MKRKVSKIGPSTLMVSLPNKWVKRYGIKKGDELEITEDGGTLTIGSQGEVKLKKTEIDVTGIFPMVKRSLGALFKSGYDEFEVHYSSLQELKDARFVIRDEFIGFEVVNQSKSSLTAKQVSIVQPEELKTMFRRMFLIIKTMNEDGLEAIKNNDYEQMEEIIIRDLDVNKISDFCRRIINKNSRNMERAPPLYFMAEQLEKVGDCLRDICKAQLSSKQKIHKQTLDMFKEINIFFNDFYTVFYKFNLTDMGKFGRDRKIIKKKIDMIFNKKQVTNLHIMIPLTKAFEATFDMNGPLMAYNL